MTLLKENISKAIKETLASPTEAIPHTFREYEVPKTPEEVTLSDRLSILENHVSELIVESFSNAYEESPKETNLNKKNKLLTNTSNFLF